MERSELFIMPAFNELCGGIPLTIHSGRPPGSCFSQAGLNLRLQVYLLDGTRLGLLGIFGNCNIQGFELDAGQEL